nr:MAG TPA: hypothetical protein [Caudoviricetes sp.]
MLKTEATAATAAKNAEMTLHARARRVSFKALRCSCSARRASSPEKVIQILSRPSGQTA